MTEPATQQGRQEILGRIRRALRVPAPKLGSHSTGPGHAASGIPLPVVGSPTMRSWLPRVGETWDEQIALFAANTQDLKAEFFLCSDWDELKTRLSALAQESGWQRIATHAGDLTDQASNALSLPIVHTNGDYDISQLEQCDAALTQCDALVAQTGSVLLTSRSAGGRALSALAPHHVVLARRDQLVPDLSAAFVLLQERYGESYPSMISFATGPSRTGDIERILVLGAHGPKRLTIFCV